MAGRITGYLLVLTGTLYLFFMYNETVLSGVLILVLGYPFVSAVSLIVRNRGLEADLERVPAMGEEGNRLKAGIVVKNRQGIFAVRCELMAAAAYTMGSGKEVKKRFRDTIPPGGERTLWFEIGAGSCGNLQIRLKRMRIYDPLGIFYITKKCTRSAGIKIMPVFETMPVEISRSTREFQAEADEYSCERRGDDPSETYQVREYREGDPLRDIHWKLTAREDELMIRERAFPLGCVVLVWIDVPAKESSAEGFSRMLRTAASLSMTLAEQKCIHMAAWYEEKNARVVKRRVDDARSVYEFIWRLMDLEPYRDEAGKEACRKEAFKGQNFSSIVTVDQEGRLRKDHEIVKVLRL